MNGSRQSPGRDCRGAGSMTYGTRTPRTCWPTGVHVKVASERLGHSKIGITLDLYSHVLPGMQEDAVAKVDAALQDAKNRA